jgi:hypothetical protein
MPKTAEYLANARECRSLAKQMDHGPHRDQLLKMAETWEVLAEQRERTIHARGEEPEVTTNTLEYPVGVTRASRLNHH